jgi:hypothetical protein
MRRERAGRGDLQHGLREDSHRRRQCRRAERKRLLESEANRPRDGAADEGQLDDHLAELETSAARDDSPKACARLGMKESRDERSPGEARSHPREGDDHAEGQQHCREVAGEMGRERRDRSGPDLDGGESSEVRARHAERAAEHSGSEAE